MDAAADRGAGIRTCAHSNRDRDATARETDTTATPTPEPIPANTTSVRRVGSPQVDVFAVIPGLPVDDDPFGALTGEGARPLARRSGVRRSRGGAGGVPAA